MKRNFYFTAALAALSATSLCSAYASDVMENDALAIQTAKINLTQAVIIAEQRVGGKAVHAELEKYNGQRVFDVEVVNDKRVMEVKVDPTNGKVLSATEDKADREDEHDKND